MFKRTFVSLFLVFAILLTLVGAVSSAPPAAEVLAQEELTYTVKLGDNLWTLAEKYLGNGPAYWAIVEATNAKHDEDSSFANIENPSLIHPGWKFIIPGAEAPVGEDLLDDILAAGVLVGATDANYPPQSFLNDAGELDGFDIDVYKEVASRLGVDVRFETPDWGLITAGSWVERWDISIGSMTPTAERSEVIWFTDPYYYVLAGFAVHADNTTFTSVDDLAGKVIGLAGETTYDRFINKDLDIPIAGYEVDYLDWEAGSLTTYASDLDAVVDLSLGDGLRLDAVMSAIPTLQTAIDEGVPIKLLGGAIFGEPLSFALDKGRGPSARLLARLNEILADMHSDGTLTALSMKWFDEEMTKVGAAAPGKTFIFGRGGDTIQLYPAVVTDGESFRVTGQILEPLFQYEDGGTVAIPALATDYSVSDDGLVWTINLREGVKFHDGTPFNADAVVFNFERQWKTDHPFHFESEVYAYYEYMWGGFDDDSIITNVEAVDDYTVEFTLREALAPMLANLAMDMFAISSPTAMEKYGEDYGTPSAGAVGTGPFKFVEWLEDDHITVDANMDYWGGAPTIGRIIWRVIPDDSARYLALKAGDIHGMEQAGIEDIKDCEADANCYVEAIGLNTGYLAFNYHITELQDPKVREAVFHAIDREGLREAFYGNYGQVPTTFLHPSMWGRPDLDPWEYDPDLSRQLLAEAGFPDGLKEVTNEDTGEVGPLKLYYMPVTRFYYPSPKEIGEAMAADLAKAGIDTELILEGDWPTYLAAAREGRLYGLFMLGWGGDNGDPDNFLCYFFCRVGDPDNIDGAGWYYNPELAELLKKAAVAPDQAARAAMYEEAETMLYDDRARLWVMHNDTPRIFSAKVSGFVVQPVGADKYEGVVIAD